MPIEARKGAPGAWPPAKYATEHQVWGVLLAAAWMLRLGDDAEAATRLERAVQVVLASKLCGDEVSEVRGALLVALGA